MMLLNLGADSSAARGCPSTWKGMRMEIAGFAGNLEEKHAAYVKQQVLSMVTVGAAVRINRDGTLARQASSIRTRATVET
jgi:hypothetical protein